MFDNGVSLVSILERLAILHHECKCIIISHWSTTKWVSIFKWIILIFFLRKMQHMKVVTCENELLLPRWGNRKQNRTHTCPEHRTYWYPVRQQPMFFVSLTCCCQGGPVECRPIHSLSWQDGTPWIYRTKVTEKKKYSANQHGCNSQYNDSPINNWKCMGTYSALWLMVPRCWSTKPSVSTVHTAD